MTPQEALQFIADILYGPSMRYHPIESDKMKEALVILTKSIIKKDKDEEDTNDN